METKELTTYCQLSFLEDFFRIRPIQTDEIIRSEKEKIWDYYAEFIFRNDNLNIDADITQIEKDKDNYYAKFIYKKYASKVNSLKKFDSEQLNFEIITKNESPIFFSHDIVCDFEKYGIMCVKTTNIFNNPLKEKFETHITPNKPPFTDWKLHPWENLKKFKHPFNFLIIVDNHILDNEDLMEENLFKILDYWLPSSATDFNLYILTDGFNITKNNTNTPKYTAELRYDKINERIKEIRKSFRINLKIIFNANTKRYPNLKNHGRNIITNYFKMHNDHTFSMFDKNKKCNINSEFYIKSILDEFIRESISTLKKQYNEIEKNAKNIGSEINVLPKESES